MNSHHAYITSGGGPFPEREFRDWYKGWSARSGIAPDPDDPLHLYDYRRAYSAGVEPTIDPQDGFYHWPSRFKAADHPNRYITLPGGGVLDSLLDEVVQ